MDIPRSPVRQQPQARRVSQLLRAPRKPRERNNFFIGENVRRRLNFNLPHVPHVNIRIRRHPFRLRPMNLFP